jgi:hypothetical protein
MKIDAELIDVINESYNRDHLQKGYLPFIRKMASTPAWQMADKKVQKILEKKKLLKEDLTILVAAVLSGKELFSAFKSVLPEEAGKLLERMVWEEYFLHEDLILSEYGIEITETKTTAWGTKNKGLRDEFYLFSTEQAYDWHNGSQYYIGLDAEIRKKLIDFFDKPEGYYLQPVQEIPQNLEQFRGEKIIFQELPRLLVYATQGHIKLTNAGIPAASTYNKMRKTLSVREFFQGLKKPYDALRTSLIASLIADSGNYSLSQEGIRSLKSIFSYFEHRFYMLHLLHHLKGTGYIDDYDKHVVGDELMGILRDFPDEDGWISMDNILKYANYRAIDVKPASDYAISRYLSYPVKKRGYTAKEPVTASNYRSLVKVPVLQAGFFLFAAFGLVDAAYAQPDKDDEADAAVSPFEPLRYVRLTPLGAFLAGRTKTYTLPENSEKINIQLLDDSLNILSDKPSETVDLMLDNYTVKVGPSRYKTNFALFMKGIRTADDLEAKISLFRQTVTDKLPPNWQAFFDTLRLKCAPLKSIGAHTAYQLSEEDEELIKLVAKDPILKKLVRKAEGLIIIVMKNDLAKFKNRLKEFGYLLE